MSRIFTKPEIEQLAKNGQPGEKGKDHIPVAKLFIRNTGCAWLLTEIDPENLIFAFGLCDLADGVPRLDHIDLSKILRLNRHGMTVERDPYFVGKYPISVYAQAAKHFGYITEVDALLIPPTMHRPPELLP